MAGTAARWLLLFIASLWLAMSFTYPLGWDQGILSWAGHIVARGGMPFRDAWDMKGPVVYYVFAFSEKLFGVHLWGIRLVDAAILLAATWSVRRATAALTDAATGGWTAIVFFLWYASHSYWHTAQPDGWVAMLLAVAILPVICRDTPPTLPRLLLLGAVIGVMTLVKPIYTAFLVIPWMYAMSGRVASQRLAGMAAFTLGWSIPLALCAGWFAARGAFDDLIAVYVRYPALAYAELGRLSVQERLRGIVEYLFQAPVVAVGLPAAVVGAVTLWPSRGTAARALALWVFIAAFVVVLQGRFFAYHWLPMLPAAIVLGAVGVHSILSRARVLAIALTAVVIAHCVAPIGLEEMRFVSWLTGRIDTASYYDAYGEPGSDMRSVAWLGDRGEGKVFVFGWNTSIAWLSHRDTVSRFGFSMPLLLGTDSGPRSAYRSEVLRALQADPPRYVILGTQSQRILRQAMTVDDFPGLATLLRTSYSQVAEFGPIQIHELGAAPAKSH